MSSKHRRFSITLWLIPALLFASASAQQATNSKREPLAIQEQGSFAVGGSVTTAPGTFDPIRQGAYNPAGADPAGQTLHGDRTGFEGPSDSGIEFWGNSFVADPFGQVIAQASTDQEEVVVTECDPKRVDEVRRNWPFFRDRRIDAYTPITERWLR